MGTFTPAQVAQLLRPINPNRVLKDGKKNSHISQQDARAHLIRVLGFGAWDLDIDGPHLVFEQPAVDGQTGKPKPGRFDVCYRAKVRLTLRDPHGEKICHFDGSATATAQNQTRGDAHGLALRSAESLALKRATINLGDQFGLSLYNKGQEKALVLASRNVVLKDLEMAERGTDVQDEVPAQVSLGHEEDIEDSIPRNRDGSTSRSRASNEQLAANGDMTRDQLKEHNALVKDVLTSPKLADRDDAWTAGPPPAEEVAKLGSTKLTRPQQSKLHALFGECGWTERDDRLRALSVLVGRDLESSSDLTRVEAKTVLDVLTVVQRATDPAGLLTDYVAAAKAADRDEMARLLSAVAQRGGAS